MSITSRWPRFAQALARGARRLTTARVLERAFLRLDAVRFDRSVAIGLLGGALCGGLVAVRPGFLAAGVSTALLLTCWMIALSAEPLVEWEETETPEFVQQEETDSSKAVAATLNLPDEPLLGFVEIPAGPFLMGSDKTRDAQAYSDEEPAHQVTLPSFYIGRFEVTVGQFTAYRDATGTKPGDAHSVQGAGDHPVRYVSWLEAIAYCEWLEAALKKSPPTPARLNQLLREGWHISLPSEAEWEKAARGTDGRIYPWGNNADSSRANYGGGSTKPVGSYPRGASPYGLLDMSGNVWEWTRSEFKPYPYDPTDGREDLNRPTARVVRGGSFYYSEWYVRAARRHLSVPVRRNDNVGFRLVVSRL